MAEGALPEGALPEAIRFRRPVEADYAPVAAVVDDWWDGRVVRSLLPRLWFRHFTGRSWLAEVDEPGAKPVLAGFVVGFISPDDPGLSVCHAIGVAPNLRRRGIGRALYERLFADARHAGSARVEALSWPGDRRSAGFHLALGFQPDDGPGALPLYGIAAFEGYDFGTEDRTRFTRSL